MTIQAPTKTRIRPAPLTASLALLWSGAILAEPGEPVLDWIEPETVIGESERSVQVPVTWTRHYGDPALTAQYWLDDELALTRAVEDGDPTQSGSAMLTIDAAGEYHLSVSLCDADGCADSEPATINVIDPTQAAALAAERDDDGKVSDYEEASRVVNEIAARIGDEAVESSAFVSSAQQSWGVWFATFVGQHALRHGLSMGFDALLEQIGLVSNAPDLGDKLNGIEQSLGAIRQQLDEISSKIDVGKADSDFKNSHRDAVVAMQNIRVIASNLAAVERGISEPTQFQLESWALDNRNNIGALKVLLIDSLTGAVPLMLDYYQLKYPVSSGIEVREQVDGYLDGFRAALGVALLNQAWLTEAFAPNAIYDEGAEKDARDTVIAAYNMTGAPYPQPPEDAAGFIHRIGTDWALVDAGRPLLSGEKARSMTQNRSIVWSRYSALAIGQSAPGTAGDASLSEYMDSNAIKRSWRDPNSVRIDHRDSFFECERSVRHDEFYIAGNWPHSATHTTYNRKYACGFGAAEPRRESEAEKARLESDFSANEKVYTVDMSGMTNSWGMPALMGARAIGSHRDGLGIESIVRGDGNAVTVRYDRNGYNWLQVRDPQTGELYFTGSNTGGRFLSLSPASGAVELVQGYRIANRDGEGSMLAKERAIVTANPGSASIELTVTP